MVYSITSKATFEWIRAFQRAMRDIQCETPPFVLVGNQVDKVSEREVSYEEGAQVAQMLGCQFFEVSAKTSHHVHRVFAVLVRQLRMRPLESKQCMIM